MRGIDAIEFSGGALALRSAGDVANGRIRILNSALKLVEPRRVLRRVIRFFDDDVVGRVRLERTKTDIKC